MIAWRRHFKTISFAIVVVVAGCATVEENPKKNKQLGLITTPSNYYTTQRARYLGEKYKTNLDSLVERIVRDPKTANLQFANNIASVGGIGFFTHSATRSVDERFLEIILGVPETFDSQLDNNVKVHRVFSLYGAELLSILASDSEIYQEKEVNGYGLNLSWRNLVSDAAGPRISLERATLYFPKARVRSFVRGELSQNTFLGEAVIFAVIDDGPMKLISYRPQELKPDSRRPIGEEPLIAGEITGKREAQPEKAAFLAPITRSSVDREQGRSSAQSVSLPKDKPAEAKAPLAVGEKLEDSNKAVSAADRLTEAPVASAPPLIETSQTKALPVIQTNSPSVGHKETESGYAASTGDLASLPVSPVMPNITDAPKVVSVKEQALLENKPTKTPLGEQSSTKVLQGFVIQLAFGEMRDARLWAETLERRGFAVSLTEAGGSGSMRVRIGNFTGREEAERQLQTLRRDGLKGIVLNLPQAYRPEVHPEVAEENGKAVSAAQ